MLQTIHDKVSGWVAKILLAVLALVFVFWGIELRSVNSSPNVAAEVDGADISLSAAQNAWQQRQIELQQSFKGALPEPIKKQQQALLLNQMIRSQLMISHSHDVGIRVSDGELRAKLASIEALQTDGKFSLEKYQAALLQRGMNEAQFEAQLRTEMATDRLQTSLFNSAFVTPNELARAQALLGEQRNVDYIKIPVSAYLTKVQVTDKDIQAWYDAHKSEYQTDESVTLQYVELKLADVAATIKADDAALHEHYEQMKDRFATPERRKARHILIKTDKELNDAAAKKLAEELVTKINGGADFSALAKQYSKDPGSATQGGDLGWAGRGMFVGPFEDALFSMKPGEVRGPVKTEFGYHVIRLDEVESGSAKPFEQVRNEVEADYQSERARTLFYDQTQKLADEAFANLTSLDGVAKSFGTQVQSIADFTRKGAGEFVGNTTVTDAAFSDAVLTKGENSPLVTLGEDRALVLRVADHRLPEQRPLDQVRADVLAKLTQNQAQQLLDKQLAETLKQLQGGALQWAEVTKTLPASPAGAALVGRNATLDASLVQAVFAIPKAQVSAAKPAFRSASLGSGEQALVMVTEVKPGSTEALPEQQSVQQRRAGQIATNELLQYVQDLERNAKIKRNPKVFE